MVLPSNSSMTYLSENTTCCFTTHLQREIKLHDEWLVGLVEIHIPCTCPVHFQDNETSYTFHTSEEDGRLIDKKVCRIPVRIYDSLEELVEAINSANGTYRHQMLEPLKNRKGSYIIRRMCNCPQIHITDFHEKIRRNSALTKQVKKDLFQRLMRVSATLQPPALLLFLEPCPTRYTSKRTYGSLMQ